MNRTKKLALWTLPFVVLGVALVWAKWRADNPTPTQFDLEVRSRFIQANDAVFKAGRDNPSRFIYHLSRAEREEIAPHLWIRTVWALSTEEGVLLTWGSKGQHEALSISPHRNHDTYVRETKIEWQTFYLHPATSKFLWRWLNEHPHVQKQLCIK